MGIVQRLRALFGTGYSRYYVPDLLPIVSGMSPRKLYETQENLYAVVSFLSGSVAQLPLKVYRRDGETDRRRDRDSVASKLLWRPNSDQTAYELWYAVMTELLLMGSAVLWLLPDSDSDSGLQLRVIPREWIKASDYETNYAPSVLKVSTDGARVIEIKADEFVEFRMYEPGNPAGHLSPINALKQTLYEQIQADRFRTEVWRSSGRFNSYITRPANVQPWDDEQRKRWVTAFREAWRDGGENAGKSPVLEDGMEIKTYQFNSKEAQYAETKQLSREDVASAYHINPSLIWHTQTQTYASAKDNARALYADCLGPILQMLQQRINSFLLPMIGADKNTYVEFDLNEKLKGSFEERASILQTATGGPWMTRNEARADNNLPPVPGGDELIVPLNVLEGGQASPTDADSTKCDCGCHHKSEEIHIKGKSDEDEDEQVAEVLRRFFRRQANSVLPKIGAGGNWWDSERWDEELADDLEPIMQTVSDTHGLSTAKKLGTLYAPKLTGAYLRKMAEGRSHAINKGTFDKLSLTDEDPDEVFEKRENADADSYGRSLATACASWATLEAVKQAEDQGYQREVLKRWVTGANARPTHASMNGETVGIHENFSNGAYWTGDDNLEASESCNCNCSTEVIIR